MKDKCKRFHPLLGAWLDGELPNRKKGRIAAHVKTCPVCRAEIVRIRAVQNLLQEGFSAALGAEEGTLSSLHERILRQIPVGKEEGKGILGRVWFRPPFLRIRPLAFSLAVTVLLGSAVFFSIYKPAPTVIRTASVNDCIVEDVESGDRTVLLFKTHGSAMTVIWVTGDQKV